MVRDSLYNIERNTKAAASSAASAAHHSANTARAAQSAATGAWVGAGFQAVSVLQSARAARAAEEQVAIQQAMAEQAQVHQFAMWRQTDHGRAFTEWRERAVHLAQLIRGHRAEWQQTWAQVTGRFQAEIPDEEKRRFSGRASQLGQPGLLVASFIALALTGITALTALYQGWRDSVQNTRGAGHMTYTECLAVLEDPDNFLFIEYDCAALAPVDTATGIWVIAAVLGAAAIALFIIRAIVRQRARRDTVFADETAARVTRYGFDPLAVTPGWEPFSWNVTGADDAEFYAGAMMNLALTGHRTYPTPGELFALKAPAAVEPQPHYPTEVNEALARFSR